MTALGDATRLGRYRPPEWAPQGIRANMVHPEAVFDTGSWTGELPAARARHYGLTVEAYKRRNLLRTEVTCADVTCAGVARLVAAMAGDVFAMTAGAQVRVDGGDERVIRPDPIRSDPRGEPPCTV
ncbi:MAG: hypothetical protein FWF28_09065 [Micrococcales bacterium]|nr:hypothetical protein [Micrococcales bacterium]